VHTSLQSYGWNFDERFKIRLSDITDNDEMTCIYIGHAQNLISPLIWIIIGSDGERLSPDNQHGAYNTISGVITHHVGPSSFVAFHFQNWGHLKLLIVTLQYKNYLLLFSDQRRWALSSTKLHTARSQIWVRVQIILSRNRAETSAGTTREQINPASAPFFSISILPK
jgi:hypothetical protein